MGIQDSCLNVQEPGGVIAILLKSLCGLRASCGLESTTVLVIQWLAVALQPLMPPVHFSIGQPQTLDR